MILVRWGLPAAIAAVGVWIAVSGDAAVGEALVGAAVCLVVASVLMRIGFSGDREREAEEAARRYFDEHGRWPEERR